MTGMSLPQSEQRGLALTTAARASALLGAVGLAVVFAGLGLSPGALWIEPFGALVHMAMLPLVACLAAPSWGRAMGFAWLALDTAVSIEIANGVPFEEGMRLRLGAHVLAAVWMGSSSWRQSGFGRFVGLAAAAAMGLHSFTAPLTGPPGILALAGPLILLWLLSLAFRGR